MDNSSHSRTLIILFMIMGCTLPSTLLQSSSQESGISDHAKLAEIIQNSNGIIRHDELQEYVSKYPKDPEGHLYLGVDYIHNQHVHLLGIPVMVIGTIRQSEESREQERLNYLSRAETCFQTFRELAPEETDRFICYSLMVELYRYNYNQVVSMMEPRVDQILATDDPLREQVLLLLAAAYREMRDVRNAMRYYQKLDVDKYPVITCLISLTYFADNDLSSAISSMEKSRFEDPDNVYGEMLLAMKCEQAHEWERTIDHYEQAEMNGKHKFPYHFTVWHIRERIISLRKFEKKE